MIKDVLPCKFCRESTAQYTNELPMKRDTGRWLYELHNKVYNKLRTQCKDDPAVINPGVDPTFEEVKQRYEAMEPNNVPGRDFLFSVAINYPDEPEEIQMATQRKFMHVLSKVYPFESLLHVFPRYVFF